MLTAMSERGAIESARERASVTSRPRDRNHKRPRDRTAARARNHAARQRPVGIAHFPCSQRL